MKKIIFERANKAYWLRKIRDLYNEPCINQEVVLEFDNSIKKEELYPIHLVTLANVIQYFYDKGNSVFIKSRINVEVYEYVYKELGFSEYWSKGKNHVDAKNTNNIFNLWRIVDSEKDLYAKQVEDYFKRKYFKDRDLSVITEVMTEVFYNVFDHAKAGKNAFSLIKYDEKKETLYAAISDFGIGITQSVKNYVEHVKTDKEALELAITDNFTVRSTERNHGLGLSNILSGSDSARIFSGEGLVCKINNGVKVISTTFGFPGTLVYFEVDLSKTEKEEIINDFDW
ncbi:MAG: ATP-binding protein [Hallella sp.]|uniref:ATP-binding protein n=1 Tax=Hallella sp. TaxID=2980186 RepID=UPI002E777D31|nr:ATP-binding protein [Hallella sp.]MED9945507.1 ATP-binding protein [Hallella sp.]